MKRFCAAALAAVMLFSMGAAFGYAAEESEDPFAGAAEDWYTALGDCKTYYGALRQLGEDVFPTIQVLSYTDAGMLELRTDGLNFLNDYELTPSEQTDDAWIYPGITWPDGLAYYPADGSIGVFEGEREDIYLPMLEHGEEYPLPEDVPADWYLSVSETMRVPEDEQVEIGLMFQDGGDGTIRAMMLPVDEFAFRTDACEGTPAGGIWYPGVERGEMYYYPAYSTVFILEPDNWIYEFYLA